MVMPKRHCAASCNDIKGGREGKEVRPGRWMGEREGGKKDLH